MATTNPKVMDLVKEELEKNPEVSVAELYKKARKLSRSIGTLTLRQFHARYPLQIKRKSKAGPTTRKKSSAKKRVAAGAAAAKKKAGATAETARKTAEATATAVRSRMQRRGQPAASERDAVRGVLLKFAADLASAEERKDAVKVIAGVDSYVDDVLSAIAKA